MSILFKAALSVTSLASPEVVFAIEKISIELNVDPILALSVGVIESGLRGPNPMGVQACYASVKKKPSVKRCIRIGVVSLRNRLLESKDKPAKPKHTKACLNYDDWKCRAAILYNRGPGQRKYGPWAMRIHNKISKFIETR